ncbi:MAG: hypothetical protein JW902_16195 [Syntrophaceae bacterium]|nr:hypothetical protein [Syntrophaceae bacterium]
MNKENLKEIENREDLFQLLCKHLSSGVVLLDGQGRVSFLNTAIKTLFDSDIHHWTDLKAFMIAMCEKPFPGDTELGEKIKRIGGFMKKGRPGEILEETVSIHRRGGLKACFTIRVTCLKNQECLILFQSDMENSSADCTFGNTWKAADTARILRRLAHDSDNVLGIVSGYAELALDDLHDREDPLRHFIQQILKGSIQARGLMKQIESLSILPDG